MTSETVVTILLGTAALLTVMVLPGLAMWAAERIAPFFVKNDEEKRMRFKSPRAMGAPFSAWTPFMVAKVTIAMLVGFAVLFVFGVAVEQAGLMR
jgi:hypothetical protein